MRNTSFFIVEITSFIELYGAISQYQNPNLTLLQYGDKAMSPAINATIFGKEHLFYKTKRFQP